MKKIHKLLKIIFPITLSFINIHADTTVQKRENQTIKTIPFTLDINNIQHKKGGQIIVFIFLEEGFPKKHEQTFSKFSYPTKEKKMSIQISIPDKRDFAIKILHDENMDGQVTKNWTGIYPKDGLGFSNDAKIGFGPPSFEEAKINARNTINSNISIIYY